MDDTAHSGCQSKTSILRTGSEQADVNNNNNADTDDGPGNNRDQESGTTEEPQESQRQHLTSTRQQSWRGHSGAPLGTTRHAQPILPGSPCKGRIVLLHGLAWSGLCMPHIHQPSTRLDWLAFGCLSFHPCAAPPVLKPTSSRPPPASVNGNPTSQQNAIVSGYFPNHLFCCEFFGPSLMSRFWAFLFALPDWISLAFGLHFGPQLLELLSLRCLLSSIITKNSSLIATATR